MTTAIVHRYDNEPDILTVAGNGCSDVYVRAANDSFELVLVVPTGNAHTQKCVVADAASRQVAPIPPLHWPGRPGPYNTRVYVRNVRYATLDKVRHAIKSAGVTWRAQWQVLVVEIDEKLLF